MIGGKLPLINGYGKAGTGSEIAIEACEFAESFLKLTPYYGVILNVDNDHLDYYGSMGALKFAFKRFALMTRFCVFANMDDPNTVDVLKSSDRNVRTFGVEAEECDFKAVNVREYRPGYYEFDLEVLNRTMGIISLSVPGYHNVYNALAMCAVCMSLGLTAQQCADAAKHFKGAGRRFELVGECNGATVVDDYAHHPAELEATLNAARKMGYLRLIAVHQPFTYSRTKALMDDFAAVLQKADVTVLTPILGSREVDDGSVKTADLAAKIPGAVEVDSLDAAAEWVKNNARRGDLVITLGCGDVYKCAKLMLGQELPK